MRQEKYMSENIRKIKPEVAIYELIQAISTPEKIKQGRNRQILSFSQYPEPIAIILHEGFFALYRSTDHMLVTHISAPLIMNINLLTADNPDAFLQFRGPISYEEVERHKLLEIVESKNQWKNIALLSMYFTNGLFNYAFKSSSIPTYDLICGNLIELINEPDGIRLTTNVCNYVQEKTLISRSHVMKILSELKKGGYIKIDKGILMEIKCLPENY